MNISSDIDKNFEKLVTAALYRAAELDEIEAQSNVSWESITPSPRMQRRMKAMLRNPSAYVRNLRRPMYKKIMRVAASFLVTITILFSAAIAISPTARAAVVNFVRTWLEDRTIYHVPQQNLDRDWSFGYIPDGFEPIIEINDEHQRVFAWEDENLSAIFVSITTGNTIVDNEHYKFHTSFLNGNITDIYESIDEEHPNMIVIHDNQYDVLITIWAYLEISIITKIAENIR